MIRIIPVSSIATLFPDLKLKVYGFLVRKYNFYFVKHSGRIYFSKKVALLIIEDIFLRFNVDSITAEKVRIKLQNF